MIECVCDYDAPTLYCDRMVTARKQHKCSECFRVIQSGERYEYVFGVWDGRPDRFKTCARCLAVKEYVKAHVPCFCWAHGSILDDAYNTVEGYAHEVPGLLFGYWRRYAATRKGPYRFSS